MPVARGDWKIQDLTSADSKRAVLILVAQYPRDSEAVVERYLHADYRAAHPAEAAARRSVKASPLART